jgi:hypothetical protein
MAGLERIMYEPVSFVMRENPKMGDTGCRAIKFPAAEPALPGRWRSIPLGA